MEEEEEIVVKPEELGEYEEVDAVEERAVFVAPVFSDEWHGEGWSEPPTPPPSDQPSAAPSKQEVVEEEAKEEHIEEAAPEEEDEEEEEEEEKELSKVSSIEERIPSVLLQPKPKTESELKMEAEHRQDIDDKMWSMIHKDLEGQPKPEESPRTALQKKHVRISQINVQGLYEPPKTYVSELSFAFDEDAAAGTAARAPETEEEVVEFIMEALRSGVRNDPESIFAVGDHNAVSRVSKFVKEQVELSRRGLEVRLSTEMLSQLGDMKQNLRNVLTVRLRELLGVSQVTVESGGIEQLEEVELSKKVKKKRMEKLSEEEQKKVVEVQESLLISSPREAVIMEGKEAMEILQEIQALTAQTREGVKAEEEVKYSITPSTQPYEKIDWAGMLTDEERKVCVDPCDWAAMQEYLALRKAQIEEELKKAAAKRVKEELLASSDPVVRLSNLNLTVTMKFVLNTGDIFTIAYRYFMKFKDIKEDLAGIFKVPADVLIIYRCDTEVLDEQCAHDLEIEPFDCAEFRLLTLDNDRWKLRSSHLEMPVPDIMTFTVETGVNTEGQSEYKEVVVEIEDRRIKKPFVGGLKDIKTGLEYHHAFTQSAPHGPYLPEEQRATRDTQTAVCKRKQIDTVCPKATQMSRGDVYISTETDKILTAKPYVDYDELCRRRDIEGKVRIIQRYLRAWILRRCIKKLSDEYRQRKACEEERERLRIKKREDRIKKDIVEMTYPKNKADFDMLYAMVERWRKAQVARVSRLKTEAPRRAEFCTLLEKEIKLLESIEVHRIRTLKEQRRQRNLRFMQKVAKPVEWTGYRGMNLTMDTLKTQRARELKDIYQRLIRHEVDHQERVELLMSLKYAVKASNTRLTMELTDLIDRECDLIYRGVKPDKLEFLRQRIEHLFTLYFKEPEFNPEVAKHSPDYNRKPFVRNIIFCKLCHTMKKYKQFSMMARDTDVNVCESCQYIHNVAVPRVDLNPFRFILRTVRRDEQKRNCYSSCAFILQDEDVRFLVMNVWRGRSCVSESDNLIDLRLPRWDVSKDWTPWNCVLLTELETKAHLKTPPANNYERHLVGEITSKHELAKRHFQQLFASDARMRDSGTWANVVDVKNYVPPPLCADLLDLTDEEKERIKKRGELYEVHETRRKDDGYVHEWPMGNDTMKSKMEIDPTTQKDAGYYECQADNQYAIDRRGFRTDYVIYTY